MVVGGRNLSSSGWWDISYIVTSKSDITETKEYILEIVKNLSEEGNYSLPTFKTDKILLGGKYKGRKISEIKKENPGYIQWCHENLDIEGLRRLGLKCN